MSVYKLIFFGLLAVLAQTSWALDSKDLLPPEQAFKLSASAVSADKVELAWDIADGYHLYQEKFKFQSQTESVQLGQAEMPEGAIEHDATFGDVVVYRKQVKVGLPLLNKTNEAQIKLLVKYQGCADIGVCYPPQKVVLEVDLAAKPAATAPTDNGLNQLVQGFKGLAPGLFAKELLPPEQAFQFFASVKDDHTIHVSWLPADGYFLYKNKLALSLDAPTQTRLGEYALPVGEGHDDPEFGQVEVYHQEVGVDVPILRQKPDAESVTLTAKYQGCADRGVCYPPMQSSVTLALPVVAVLAPDQPNADQQALANVSEQDRIVSSLKQDGFALTLLSFFGFGLLLAFTPCVFPMIPILSGIIVGQGGDISTRKAFLLSLSYVVASALMYTLFGILAALFGSNLQATFQEPWVIAVFSGLFVVLSLSMFGFYNLELPKSLQSWMHDSSDRHRDGSYFGAGVMGALASLIVGPCVAAPLAAALIYIGQTGDLMLGGSALFVMGLGMGVPLLLLGASAGKLLPKAGAWLNSTKAVFGVLMLGVAVWMLSRIVPPAVTMLLTAMLLIIPAIYMNAIEPLPAPASGWRKL
ncbi:MAG: protein-disulfide reductase DsbD, partial [Methylomonas sp.]